MHLFDVVIVGFGPVGATLANLLAQQGMSVALLERETSVYHLARAGHFDAEIMRVFQGIGIAEEVEAETEITKASRFVDADGTLLMEWKRGGAKGPLGWVSDYMFFQPALEATLRNHLAKATNVTRFLAHDVYAIEQQTDSVTVRAEDLSKGSLVAVCGKYVIGCDGARSLVRRTIGGDQEDLGFKQRWLVVDVKQHKDLGLERVSTHHCNPERPMYASVLAHNTLRWELMLKDTDDKDLVNSHDAIWDFIENSVRPISRSDGVITRSATYTFESLLANKWRDGRLLLAGDSAHRTPPFLGQGMCAGMRDAANLAWKLAAVCDGRADSSLLDSYEVERRPHVRAFIEGAVEAGKFLHMFDAEELAARARDMRANPKAYAPPDPSLGPGLSPAYGSHGLGKQIPQPRVDSVLMDELIGHEFGLICDKEFFDSEDERTVIAAKFPRLKVVMLDEPASESALKQYHSHAVFVRPDKYVHSTLKNPGELRSLLASFPVDLH